MNINRFSPKHFKKMVKNKKDLSSPYRIRKTAITNKNISVKTNANVQVLVRVRPLNEKELKNCQRIVVDILDEYTIIFDPKDKEEQFFYHGVPQKGRDLLKKPQKNLQFNFDQVFGYDSTNEDVFDKSTKNLMKSLMNGYNCSVFVYGVTGAGKTHTMIGHNDSPGITYLTMKELFQQMENLKSTHDFELRMSYLEVYNETVNDLLNPGQQLHLREDNKFGVFVSGITIIKILNPTELFEMLKKGNSNRTQHPTDANAESSRSHAVFQVYIQMSNRLTFEKRVAKLSMIDLAGSERGAVTGCSGVRFTEGANINKSLLALGNCINSLADGQRHIPYRDSKLTRLLKDSLGGNCQTIMIANVSPSSINYEDTYNTLKYATRAKKIKSAIKQNVIKKELTTTQYEKLILELTNKNKQLEIQLEEKEKQPCNCDQILPQQTFANEIIPNTEKDLLNEKLRQFYKEKSLIQRQILRYENEEHIVELKRKFKEQAINKLKQLSDSDLSKDMNRILNTVEKYQQKIGNLNIQKNNLNMLKTSVESNIYTLKTNEPDDNILSQLQNTLDNEYLTEKLMYKEKELELFELELIQRNKFEEKLVNVLKPFYTMLSGYGHLTDNMKQEYYNLLQILHGTRCVTWKDEEINPVENKEINLNIDENSLLLSIGKNITMKDQLSYIKHSCNNNKERIKKQLYVDIKSPNIQDTKPLTNLNETFNLLDLPDVPTGSNTNLYKPKINSAISSNTVLPKVRRSLRINDKENRNKIRKVGIIEKTQKFVNRKRNQQLTDTVLKKIGTKTALTSRPLTPRNKDLKDIKKPRFISTTDILKKGRSNS